MHLKRRKVTPLFDRVAAMAYAQQALSQPPKKPLIKRPERPGNLVAQFVLPMALCLTTNRRACLHWAAVDGIKDRILSQLRAQCGRLSLATLAGRPQVLVVRFTTRRPDSGAGWEKDAIDALLTPKVIARKGGLKQRKGLGLLNDDSDADIDRNVWWEPGPKDGFVYIEIRSGQ
jgi:hypothetical protein